MSIRKQSKKKPISCRFWMEVQASLNSLMWLRCLKTIKETWWQLSSLSSSMVQAWPMMSSRKIWAITILEIICTRSYKLWIMHTRRESFIETSNLRILCTILLQKRPCWSIGGWLSSIYLIKSSQGLEIHNIILMGGLLRYFLEWGGMAIK